MKTFFILLVGSIVIADGDIVATDGEQLSIADRMAFDSRDACEQYLISFTDNDWTIKKDNSHIWSFLNVNGSNEVFFLAQCVEVTPPQ